MGRAKANAISKADVRRHVRWSEKVDQPEGGRQDGCQDRGEEAEELF
jgi:hypothetical protein